MTTLTAIACEKCDAEMRLVAAKLQFELWHCPHCGRGIAVDLELVQTAVVRRGRPDKWKVKT